MNKVNVAVHILTENDPNVERRTKVNRDVYDMISRYKEMLREENFRQVNQL
jgi:hypothetical protein